LNDEKLQEIIGWKPHEPQREILKSKSRDKVICAGRRFGKSYLCAYEGFRGLLIDDYQTCLIAPTYDLTQRVFDYITVWIQKEFPSVRIQTRPFPMIKMPWGSQLDCKSADAPTGILGKGYDLVIVDECSRIPRRIYETYVFPTTSQTEGKSVFISTPFGKNWFYDKWIDTKETKGSFHFSSKDNPFFPIKAWDRAKQKLPEDVFKQEYEALFLEDAAAVFRGIKEIISDDCLHEPEEHRYILGVDLGKHEDFTVLTVMDRFTHKVVYWTRFKKIHYPLQKERVYTIAKKYNNARVIIDSTGLGDPISDDLKHHGLMVDDFKISGKSKKQLIDKLSIFIEQKAISIPPERVLIDELESYGYQLSDAGNIKYSAPTGLHDDAVISLALSVWGLYSPKIKNPTKLYKPPLKTKKTFQYF